MYRTFWLTRCLLVLVCILNQSVEVVAQPEIPEVLKPWKDWVTWDDDLQDSPTTYLSANDRISIWPSQLSLSADQQSGAWSVTVHSFARTWVSLPGSGDTWPMEVTSNGNPIAVVERNGRPAVQLPVGEHVLAGAFHWDEMPQRIMLPSEVGIVSLTVDGQTVPLPNWDADGQIWLKRVRAEQTERDLISAQVYRVVEDGIPIWLSTEIELTVSGKSREESLGWILPEGFRLSTIDSSIPVAVDDSGRMKVQVRAGKWTIRARAFRVNNVSSFRFADGAEPMVDQELIGFQARPAFRLAEIEGLPTIDVTQTTFPEAWRQLPVFQWNTSTPFQLTEKMRGMGLQRPDGLTIRRQFWLDDDGGSLTYQDQISGTMQEIWRLDAAEGQEIGAVRVDGNGQLITANPQNGSHGVELRARNLNLEAIGRIENAQRLSATGWQTDADSLDATFVLPPGWRAFAVLGADTVEGDWLTAWTLLDLFLLLIFTIAVYRICGLRGGVVAFIAFGLAYHELGAPRYSWLFLLMPVAILKVVPAGVARQWLTIWKYAAVVLLTILLVPFLCRQVETAIYPQLEVPGISFSSRRPFSSPQVMYQSAVGNDLAMQRGTEQGYLADETKQESRARFATSNLKFDPQARIQTGPAQPQWSWNLVHCAWNGPVAAEHSIRPILIPRSVHRVLTVVRIVFLLLLAGLLLGRDTFGRNALGLGKSSGPGNGNSGNGNSGNGGHAHSDSGNGGSVVPTTLTILLGVGLLCVSSRSLSADEIPSQPMLDALRQRLLEPADVYPRAAEIASVDLQVNDARVSMTAEIHTAIEVAVPLPGRVPVWSPVSVTIGDQPAKFVCRKDGYLWVVLPAGVHNVAVESLLSDVSEWSWTFPLKPRRVNVTAPDWTVTGVPASGIPAEEVFFNRIQRATEGEAAYDRKDFHAIVAVDRYLEIGLVWQVRTEVRHVAESGKSVSLKIPLLSGERMLSSHVVEDGMVQVTLGAGQDSFSWTSEIPVGAAIQLTTNENDSWVERWHLVTSPVWNMTQSGLTPVFESYEQNMVPVWYAWPGENATLTFHRPEAVSGDVLTVQRVDHTVSLGTRQQDVTLHLEVECSLGSDFELEIPSNATVTSVHHEGQAIPVRRDDAKLIIPIRPGRQSIDVNWETKDVHATVMDSGRITLPVDSFNASTTMQVSDSRWVLWASGPLRGPAVRFWTILATSILVALVLGSLPNSPLRRIEWVLLGIGLTQLHVVAAIVVVAWIFLLQRRGQIDPATRPSWTFNLCQFAIVCWTLVVLGIFLAIVRNGLLGHPEMFIVGNESNRYALRWFHPRGGTQLPIATVISVSAWYYRLLMLFWALWLASSLLRWLKWGWEQFCFGGAWRRMMSEKKADPSGVHF